jgi:hypothetical protein
LSENKKVVFVKNVINVDEIKDALKKFLAGIGKL